MKLPSISTLAFLSSVLLHAVIAAAVHALGGPSAPRHSSPIAMEIRSSKPPPAPPPIVVPESPPLRAEPRKEEPVRRSSPQRPAAPVLPTPPAANPSPDAVSVAPAPAAPASPEPGEAQPAAPAQAPPAAVSRPGVAGGRGVDLSAYLGQVNRAVASRRRYPPMAIELQLEGDSVVSVRINHDGSLASRPAIARSCGHEILDAEALRMVAQSAPFPPLPDGYLSATAELQIPVRFRLEE